MNIRPLQMVVMVGLVMALVFATLWKGMNDRRDVQEIQEDATRRIREMRIKLEATQDVCREVLELGITTLDGRKP